MRRESLSPAICGLGEAVCFSEPWLLGATVSGFSESVLASVHLGEIGLCGGLGEASRAGPPECFHGTRNCPMRSVPRSLEGLPAAHHPGSLAPPWQARQLPHSDSADGCCAAAKVTLGGRSATTQHTTHARPPHDAHYTQQRTST